MESKIRDFGPTTEIIFSCYIPWNRRLISSRTLIIRSRNFLPAMLVPTVPIILSNELDTLSTGNRPLSVLDTADLAYASIHARIVHTVSVTMSNLADPSFQGASCRT